MMEEDSKSLHKKTNKIHPFEIKETPETTPKVVERQSWNGKYDFFFSALSYSVGLGAVWRFPYQCFNNGGGAFLIPFGICMIIIGIPLMYLELAVGQFTSRGPALSWVMTPLFKGLGISMNMINNYVNIYYIMILAYSLYYIVLSFTLKLPWQYCDDAWKSPNCVDDFTSNNFTYNECLNETLFLRCPNGQCYDRIDRNDTECPSKYLNDSLGYWDPIYPSQDFWNNVILKSTKSIDDSGELVWQLVLVLLASWVVCFLCLFRGVKLSGKIVYFTALFPYLVLFILGIYGFTLNGAGKGIFYFFKPDIEKLSDILIWKNAAVQVFFTLSLAYGGNIALSSYNKFNNNILRDTLILAVTNFLTCILAGMVVFAYMGNLSETTQLPISKVAQSGQGLIYVVYPYAVTLLPASPVFSIMFFLMMLSLGMGTMMASVETLTTSMEDYFPVLKANNKNKAITLAIVCMVFFLLGLVLCLQSGTYWVDILDEYAGGWALFLIGVMECISVSWVYGVDRLETDMSAMFGLESRFNKIAFIWWKICWMVITPFCLLFITILYWTETKPIEGFPQWTLVFGELLAFSSLTATFGWIIYELIITFTQNKSFRRLINKDKKWHPAEEIDQEKVQIAYEDYQPISIYKYLKRKLIS